MDVIKTREEIDHAIESTAGIVLEIDTVAIWDLEKEMYGIYVANSKGGWKLQMTTARLDFLEIEA